MFVRLLHIEQSSVEDCVYRCVRVLRFYDFRVGIQATDDFVSGIDLLRLSVVDLIQHYDICELDLIRRR